MPDDVVYGLVKALDGNKAKLSDIHLLATEFVIEAGLEPLGAPAHPGAERYYKEKGVLNNGQAQACQLLCNRCARFPAAP